MLDSSVLVLNRLFVPIHVTTVRRCFALVFAGGARVVDESYATFTFEEWSRQPVGPEREAVGTVGGAIAVPRVIVLQRYDRMPRRQVRFSRANIFSRDAYTCQYCARKPSRAEMNLDHVIPRAQGGRTTWENVVASCVSCNRRKGGRTPEQAGFELRRKPSRPRWTPLLTMSPGSARYQEWRPFLSNGMAPGFEDEPRVRLQSLQG